MLFCNPATVFWLADRPASLWSGCLLSPSLTRCSPPRVTCGPTAFCCGRSSLWVKAITHLFATYTGGGQKIWNTSNYNAVGYKSTSRKYSFCEASNLHLFRLSENFLSNSLVIFQAVVQDLVMWGWMYSHIDVLTCVFVQQVPPRTLVFK